MTKQTWLLAIAGVFTLMFVAAAPGAQDAKEPVAEAKAEFIEKTYELRALLADAYEREQESGPSPELSLYGWREGSDDELDWPSWLHAHSYGAFLFDGVEPLQGMIERLSLDGELESVRPAEYRKTRLVVKATEPLHARIAKALELLTAYVQARIRIEIRRLDSLPDALVQAQSASGTLIASREICHGGFALFSDVRKTRITWSADQSFRGTVPETADHFSGEEWGVGALIMHDGRIRLQAWHGRLTDDGVRSLQTKAGLIQLPSGTWDATPGSAIVPSGGGLILDAAGGPYLVTAHTEARIPNETLDDGVTTFWNAAGALPAGEFTSAWHAGPAWETGRGERTPLILPLGAETRSFRSVKYPEHTSKAAADFLFDAVESFLDNRALMHVNYFGPLLVLQEATPDKRDDPKEIEVARAEIPKLMDGILSGPGYHTVATQILRVPKTVQVPKGVESGKPTDADIALLTGAKGVTVAFQRKAVLATGQEADLATLKMQNYLAGYFGWGSSDDEVWYNTQVATQSMGVQVRVRADSTGRLYAVAGWRHSGQLREIKADGELEGETLEAPEWNDVQFRLDDIVGNGEALTSVQPLDDDSVAVFIVRRQEEK
jgi:hypothetical protein